MKTLMFWSEMELCKGSFRVLAQKTCSFSIFKGFKECKRFFLILRGLCGIFVKYQQSSSERTLRVLSPEKRKRKMLSEAFTHCFPLKILHLHGPPMKAKNKRVFTKLLMLMILRLARTPAKAKNIGVFAKLLFIWAIFGNFAPSQTPR